MANKWVKSIYTNRRANPAKILLPVPQTELMKSCARPAKKPLTNPRNVPIAQLEMPCKYLSAGT